MAQHRGIHRRTFGTLALAGLAATAAGRAAAQDRLRVVAVNYPLAYFAERIAGPHADVSFPVPDDVDPSFWRPGIPEISPIQLSDIILLNGASFAEWTARVTLPRSRIVVTAAAFEDAFIATETITHSHGDGGEHSHTGTASYTWLDFAQAGQQAEAVAAALVRRKPDAEAEFAANLDGVLTDLDALDAEAREVGLLAGDVGVITSHPRYQYFGRAYGLSLSAVDWDAAEPPSEAQWQALEALAADTGARVFVWEAMPDAPALARIEQLGLENVVFPPLARRPLEGDFVSATQASLADLRRGFQSATAG